MKPGCRQVEGEGGLRRLWRASGRQERSAGMGEVAGCDCSYRRFSPAAYSFLID